MRCPQCGQELDDGTAICDHCDHIIDKSFLGDDFTDMEPDPPEPSEPTTERGPPPRPRSSRRPPRPASQDSTEPERPSARRSAQDTPVDSNTAPPSGSLSVEASRVTDDVSNTLKKIWGNFQRLTFADKLAVGGAVGMFLFAFFPWVSVSGVGAVIGFEVGGLFTTVLMGATIALVFMRQNEHWRDKEKYILYVQTGIGILAVLFTLSKMFSLGKTAPFPVSRGVPGAATASVGAGLFLCFLSSVAVLGGALILLKEKVLKK
ncbi:hypothetical protein ACFL2F_01015 [Myxococcota bacterium]